MRINAGRIIKYDARFVPHSLGWSHTRWEGREDQSWCDLLRDVELRVERLLCEFLLRRNVKQIKQRGPFCEGFSPPEEREALRRYESKFNEVRDGIHAGYNRKSFPWAVPQKALLTDTIHDNYDNCLGQMSGHWDVMICLCSSLSPLPYSPLRFLESSSTSSTFVQIETWQLSSLSYELVSAPMCATLFCFQCANLFLFRVSECGGMLFGVRLPNQFFGEVVVWDFGGTPGPGRALYPPPVRSFYIAVGVLYDGYYAPVFWMFTSGFVKSHLPKVEACTHYLWFAESCQSQAQQKMTRTSIHAPWSLRAVSLGRQRNIWGCYKSRRGSSWLGGLCSKRDHWTSMAQGLVVILSF